MSLLSFQAQTALPSKWDIWPFNAGYGGDWQTSLATYAYSALILGLICVFLRVLFGPGGIWRDKELEREADEARQKALDELETQLQSGEITPAQYKMEKRRIES
jgi:hypothetical protein